MQRYTARPPLRITLDTTFAGTNPTGVGIYSRRLATHLQNLADRENLSVACIGQACRSRTDVQMLDIVQEWPLFTQTVVPAFAARHRSHVIHSTSHLGPLIGAAPRIVTVHDLLFLRYPADYNPIWLAITRTLLPRVLQRSTAIIADSIATAHDIQRFYPRATRKIQVIYPGVDHYGRHRLTEQVQAGGSDKERLEEPYILCLGPWVGRKNLGVVVSAFERLAATNPALNLVITGSLPRGMKAEGGTDLTRRLPRPIQSRVRLAGHVPPGELRALVGNAALLAYPSRAEGFGLPPLEAMSAGVPVVAADTPVAHEVYANAALYAPVDDPDAWANAIRLVLDDHIARTRLIAAGLERSAAFSWERCAGECVALYRRVQAGREGNRVGSTRDTGR